MLPVSGIPTVVQIRNLWVWTNTFFVVMLYVSPRFGRVKGELQDSRFACTIISAFT